MRNMTRAAPPTAIPTIAPVGRWALPVSLDVAFVAEGREAVP